MTVGRLFQSFKIKSVARLRMPALARWIAPSFWWPDRKGTPHLYLTFDDGPVPEVTPWVIELLWQYRAKATFFCVGENVERNPELVHQLLNEGHSLGHHTENHLNGWKTVPDVYIENTHRAAQRIGTDLFRPPYGRITPTQVSQLRKHYRIVLWDLVTGDYDSGLTAEEIVETVISKTRNGDILVFHDSIKAWPRLQIVLPIVLKTFTQRGFEFRRIPT